MNESDIQDVLRKHRIEYDSFDQNSDSWYCICRRGGWYTSRQKGEDTHLVPLLMGIHHGLEYAT